MCDGFEGKIIPVEKWSDALSAFKGDLPMPFTKDIFLYECHVAGTTHVDEIQERIGGLGIGSLLKLRREPKNKYDKYAILVLNESDLKLGYVPRANNLILSRLLDGGKLLFAMVTELDIGDWIKITVKIYMRD